MNDFCLQQQWPSKKHNGNLFLGGCRLKLPLKDETYWSNTGCFFIGNSVGMPTFIMSRPAQTWVDDFPAETRDRWVPCVLVPNGGYVEETTNLNLKIAPQISTWQTSPAAGRLEEGPCDPDGVFRVRSQVRRWFWRVLEAWFPRIPKTSLEVLGNLHYYDYLDCWSTNG